MKLLDRLGLAAKRKSEALEEDNKKLRAALAFADGERWMLAQILESKEDDINSLIMRLEEVLGKYNMAITTNQEFSSEMKRARTIIKGLIELVEYERASNQKYLNGLIEGEGEPPEIKEAKDFIQKIRKVLN